MLSAYCHDLIGVVEHFYLCLQVDYKFINQELQSVLHILKALRYMGLEVRCRVFKVCNTNSALNGPFGSSVPRISYEARSSGSFQYSLEKSKDAEHLSHEADPFWFEIGNGSCLRFLCRVNGSQIDFDFMFGFECRLTHELQCYLPPGRGAWDGYALNN